MKTRLIISLISCLTAGLFSQCKAPLPGPNLTRTWKASEVKEGNVIVYRDGASNNIYPGYRQFRMSFQDNKVSYTEFTSETFSGNWALTNNNQTLTFTNIQPEPYGTGGVIDFTLIRWSTNQLVLRRNTPNPKTGDKINEYTLVPN